MALTFARGIHDLPVWKVDIIDRAYPPSPSRVKALEEAIAADGQLSPIIVRAVTDDTYKLICGAARLTAIRNLGWPTVAARIAAGPSIELRIAELAENHDRHDLTRKQRAEIAGKLADLRRQREEAAVKDVEPAKGGRGKKGGLREAARSAGISETTARRRGKVRQNVPSGAVSAPPAEPAPPAPVAPPVEHADMPVMANVALDRLMTASVAPIICDACGHQISTCPKCGSQLRQGPR